jgi:uncharacterized membrane protein
LCMLFTSCALAYPDQGRQGVYWPALLPAHLLDMVVKSNPPLRDP